MKVLFLAALLCPLTALAAPTPGLWQLTYRFDNTAGEAPAKPAPARDESVQDKTEHGKHDGDEGEHRHHRKPREPMVVEYCLTDDQNPNNVFFTAEFDSHRRRPMPCNQENLQVANGQANWNLVCTTPDGSIKGEGQATFTDTTYNGSQNLPAPGPDNRSRTRYVTGQRIGDCP